MSEEEPEAKDRLREDIKNSIRNNLSIDIGDAGSICNTPDTETMSVILHEDARSRDIHWVYRPEDQGKASNGAEECSSLLVLVLHYTTTIDGELVDHD